MTGTASAILLLVYGRGGSNDLETTGAVSLADLRDLFPGY